MVRSMDADSRQGRVCGCPDAAAAGGCHATECTQSSWPISTDSSMAVSRELPAWMRGFGAYLMAGTTRLACDAARASPPSRACWKQQVPLPNVAVAAHPRTLALAYGTWRSRLAALAAQGRGLQAQQVTSLPAPLARWPRCGCSCPEMLRQAAGDLQQSSLQVFCLCRRLLGLKHSSCRHYNRPSSECVQATQVSTAGPCLLHCRDEPVGRLRIGPSPDGPAACTPA